MSLIRDNTPAMSLVPVTLRLAEQEAAWIDEQIKTLLGPESTKEVLAGTLRGQDTGIEVQFTLDEVRIVHCGLVFARRSRCLKDLVK